MDLQNKSLINNVTNGSALDESVIAVFIAFGYAHLAIIVLPTLLLGSAILPLVVLDYKKTRGVTSLIFMFIVLISIIGASTHGLLMDLSLITDIPLLGGCNVPLYWFLFGICHITLTVWNALLSIIQYAVIRWRNDKRLKVLTATLVTVLVLLLLSTSFFSLSRINDRPYKLRGSHCPRSRRTLFTNLRITFNIVVFMFPSVIIISIFAGLTYRFIKRNTIDNSKLVKTILKILIINAVSTTILRLLPFLGLFWLEIAEPYSSLLPYFLDLNYPLQLIVTTTVHKGIRTMFKEKILCCGLEILSHFKNSKVSSSSALQNT